MSRKKFYEIVPQMETYDNLGYEWVPFMMFSEPLNFRSKVVNTDINGFRFNNIPNSDQKSIFDNNEDKNKNLVCGNSFGFGYGASDDTKTLPAIISEKDSLTLNLCSSAHVGFQEIQSLLFNINRLKNVKKIFIFTGLNDFYLSNIFGSNYPDSFFFESDFISGMDTQTLSLQKKFFKFIVNLFLPDYVNSKTIKKIHKKDIFKFLASKDFRKSISKFNLSDKVSLQEKISRNFKIYKMISNTLNAELEIFFQPYIFWCKDLSPEEKKLIDLTRNIYTPQLKKMFSIFTNENYLKVIKIYEKSASTYGLKFRDLNNILRKNINSKKWLFVDGAHANDEGYKIISEIILDS